MSGWQRTKRDKQREIPLNSAELVQVTKQRPSTMATPRSGGGDLGRCEVVCWYWVWVGAKNGNCFVLNEFCYCFNSIRSKNVSPFWMNNIWPTSTSSLTHSNCASAWSQPSKFVFILTSCTWLGNFLVHRRIAIFIEHHSCPHSSLLTNRSILFSSSS